MKKTHIFRAALAVLCLHGAVVHAQVPEGNAADAPLVQWVPSANGAVSANAIIGGAEGGHTLPVCRASFKNGVHPGKVVGKTCNFGYGGNEVLSSQYEVLAGNPGLLKQSPQLVRWIAAQSGQVPPGAFIGAFEPSGTILLICQASWQGGVHVGKVFSGSCYFGYGGREVPSPQYAVLVVGPMVQTVPASLPKVAELEARASSLRAALASLQAEPPVKSGNARLNASRNTLEANTTETLAKFDVWLSETKAAGATSLALLEVEKFNADTASSLKTMAKDQADIEKLIWEILREALQGASR